MAKKTRYKFAKKEYAQNGCISAWIAVVSAVSFFISVGLSVGFSGNAGSWIGGFGLLSILLSMFGFLLGAKGYSEKDCSHIFCTVGTIANGMICILYLALYTLGVS